MADPARDLRTTPAEWLAWEEAQPERHELLGREPRLMAGGSDRHGGITTNLIAAIREQLRGGPCRVRADVKVQLPSGRWTYPDLFVRCSPRRGEETVIDDPVVIVEVLSPRTESYGTQDRRWAYQEIASLQQLVFVAQDRAKVEVATRAGDGTWRSVFHVGIEAELTLESLGVSLPLAGLYEDVELSPPAAVPSTASAQSDSPSESSTTTAKA